MSANDKNKLAMFVWLMQRRVLDEESEPTLIQRAYFVEPASSMLTEGDYIFFWKPNEVHGWASQWYPSKFIAQVKFGEDAEHEEVEFPSTEHWMMVQKALLFGDVEMAREILGVTGVGAGDMAYVKSLGRKVQNFDEEKWLEARERIVLEGNVYKFSQNEELKAKLLATGEKRIVEASPRDRIWGVGFGAKNALSQKERWGLNLLGQALEQTRGRLLE